MREERVESVVVVVVSGWRLDALRLSQPRPSPPETSWSEAARRTRSRSNRSQ